MATTKIPTNPLITTLEGLRKDCENVPEHLSFGIELINNIITLVRNEERKEFKRQMDIALKNDTVDNRIATVRSMLDEATDELNYIKDRITGDDSTDDWDIPSIDNATDYISNALDSLDDFDSDYEEVCEELHR